MASESEASIERVAPERDAATLQEVLRQQGERREPHRGENA
jgi:hypothetical protein